MTKASYKLAKIPLHLCCKLIKAKAKTVRSENCKFRPKKHCFKLIRTREKTQVSVSSSDAVTTLHTGKAAKFSWVVGKIYTITDSIP